MVFDGDVSSKPGCVTPIAALVTLDNRSVGNVEVVSVAVVLAADVGEP